MSLDSHTNYLCEYICESYIFLFTLIYNANFVCSEDYFCVEMQFDKNHKIRVRILLCAFIHIEGYCHNVRGTLWVNI